jgi:hypothetical protein
MTERIQVNQSAKINWSYPQIYDDDDDGRDQITIGMEHVRASDQITIEFNSERNGWVIKMDKTKYDDEWGMTHTVEEDCEVAFIPAWNEADDITVEEARKLTTEDDE